ncbi:MAG: pseudouridine synthase [Myxococcota bacterium]|nr:pseudouridine synthase [Myxococcota bacterium]
MSRRAQQRGRGIPPQRPRRGRTAPARSWLHPRQTDPPPAAGAQARILYQDAQLLIAEKPAGWLTHSDGRRGDAARPDLVSALTQPGLGVHQRLDVSTSGLLAFSRNTEGAKLIRDALASPREMKRYLAVVEGALPARQGKLSGPVPEAPGRPAETLYRRLAAGKGWSLLELTPLTGRTHQLRAHLAAAGAPIRGDGRYGDPFDLRAPQLLLHAWRLQLPGRPLIESPPPAPFAPYLATLEQESMSPRSTAELLRASLEGSTEESAYRLLNGTGDGHPGWIVDRYGDWLWVQQREGHSPGPLPEARGVYRLLAQRDRSRGGQQAPTLWRGEAAPQPLEVYEAGVPYLVELGAQLSTGIFLDQRPQRVWLREEIRRSGGGRVLNTFAHAGAFSVAAAAGDPRCESVNIDLSARWLERLKPQLQRVEAPEEAHQLYPGDVFDWLQRFQRRGERFDHVILDPPSTSVGRKKKRWSARRDYGELAALAAPLVAPKGWLISCCNHRQLSPIRFAHQLAEALPEDFRLERVCAPAIDHPSLETAPLKVLLWRRQG